MNESKQFKRSSKTNNNYSSDRPIGSKKQDILKRSGFAERLADDLKSWDGNDSLVVALYGSWGSGKSSVKNMVLESIRRKRSTAIPVMEFNPWQISGTGDIPATFFRELEIILGGIGPSRDVNKRASKLKSYSGLLSVAGSAANSIGSFLTLLGRSEAPVIQATAGGFKAAAAITKEGSEALGAKSEYERKSLHELKAELSTLMANLPRPVLVVIDDIDRLTADEIRQVFQLVKATADFPRLVFLLLFERGVVTKALNAISDDKGGEFLEKIIQVGYHIPHASNTSVQKALFEGLNSHLNAEAIEKRWDKRRWNTLFSDGIGGYFRNLRHVKRFLASFAFHVRAHRSENSFEVNPVDLIGLETMRVFEPVVYESLPGAKTILTRYESPGAFGQIKQEVIDKALLEIISSGSPENQGKVREILNVLFPPVSTVYDGDNQVMSDHDEWLREQRVCHPDMFEKYFTMTVADDDLSQAELESLLASTHDSNLFVTASRALVKRGLLQLAFERLDAYKGQISLEAMPSIVKALCDIADDFPASKPKSFMNMFEHDLNAFAWRFCYFGLRREPDKKKRFQIVKDAVTRTNGITLPFHLVSNDQRVGDRETRGHEFLLDASDLAELKEMCVRKFRDAAKNQNIRHLPQLRIILLEWSSWDSTNEVRSLMKDQIQSASEALWLLTALLGESHSYGQDHRVTYSISLGILERFIEIPGLIALLGIPKRDKLTKIEQIALREFNKALKRRDEGKSDNPEKMMQDPDEEIIE